MMMDLNSKNKAVAPIWNNSSNNINISCGPMRIVSSRSSSSSSSDQTDLILGQKKIEEARRRRITTKLSYSSQFKMTTMVEEPPQVFKGEEEEEQDAGRNRLGGRSHHHHLHHYRRRSCLVSRPAGQRRHPQLLHLSSAGWATFSLLSLALIMILISATRWLGTEAIKLQPDGRDKFHWTSEQFVITCQNNNNIKNVKIRWYGPNDQEIPEDRSQRVHTESSGPHGHRLVVHNATAPTDEGRYRCTLGSTDDRNPRESIDFRLKLYKATNFEATEDNVVLQAGQTGSLICRVEFDPSISPATVSWARGSDKRPIELLNDSTYRVMEYDPVRQISQLVVTNVNKSHDDVYTCSASAITEHLSKISDHKIKLETIYEPHFDQLSHTVWIERALDLAPGSRAYSNMRPMGGNGNGGGGSANGATTGSGRRHNSNKQHYPQPNGSVRPRPSGVGPEVGGNGTQMEAPQIVTVELRCSCEANPPASIRWSSPGTNFILGKGEPAHILDERLETEGHNTTSILIVGYNLDQTWPHKQDSYVCSASNRLGKAMKTYTIEQSDPPPAFHVGQHKSYNPLSKLFEFTLLGPNWNPAGAGTGRGGDQVSQQRQRQEIVPPVDSFRIRASSSQGPENGGGGRARQLSEPSVQWNLNGTQQDQQQQLQQQQPPQPTLPLPLSLPQNFTVSLGRLPSGNLRLYLEAHNAVGWSPNATYLGEFNIVSGASSLMVQKLFHFCCPLLLMAYSLLVSAAFH